MFFMVAASFFFVCGVSAASQVDFSLQPGETMVVYLDNEYTFTVPDDSAGDYGFFNWTVSERPISHSGLVQSSVVNYAGASMPNITVSAQRDSTYSGNVTFMFDSAVGSGAKVRIYLSVAVTLQNQTDNPISGYMNLNFSAWNYNGNSIPNIGSVNDKLNQILNELGSDVGNANDFFGSDALVYFSPPYFNSISSPGQTATINDDGFFYLSGSPSTNDFSIYYRNKPDYSIAVSLSPGVYQCSIVLPGNVDSVSFGDFEVQVLSSKFFYGVNYTYYSFIFKLDELFTSYRLMFTYTGNITSGIFYGSIRRSDSDEYGDFSINPDQSGLVDDVDNAGQQQQQQEEQLWTNINSYKGDLTFNLDDWSEAAGGLSYVSGIFMQIWNNSPTQIIILSLMLGIAMLSIGRGVQAAVRVSRHRDDD